MNDQCVFRLVTLQELLDSLWSFDFDAEHNIRLVYLRILYSMTILPCMQ